MFELGWADTERSAKSPMCSEDSLDYGPIKRESEEKKAKADLSSGSENARCGTQNHTVRK